MGARTRDVHVTKRRIVTAPPIPAKHALGLASWSGAAVASAPEFRGVQPDHSSRPALDFLHQMPRSARPVAALAVPETDEDDSMLVKSTGGPQHPQIVALIGIGVG